MGDRIAVIKLGILQQVGAPTELYDRPANVFVAGFIGSPSMNINTHPVINGQAKIRCDTIDLPREAVAKLTAEDNGQIIVGFRPEDADLAAADDPNAFSLEGCQRRGSGLRTATSYGNIITDGSAAEASTMMSYQNKLTHGSREPACAAEDRRHRQDQDRPDQDAPVRSVDRAASELMLGRLLKPGQPLHEAFSSSLWPRGKRLRMAAGPFLLRCVRFAWSCRPPNLSRRVGPRAGLH